jgi:hypothetical protein
VCRPTSGPPGAATQAVNETTYTHARPEDLALAAIALSKMHNLV